MKQYILIFLFIFCLFPSCKEKNHKQQVKLKDYSRSIKIKDTIKKSFKMPEYEPFIFEFSAYTFSGSESIYSLSNDSLVIRSFENSYLSISVLDSLNQLKIKQFEKIHIYELENNYTSQGIKDGSQIKVKFTKQGTTKKIWLRNYYHQQLSPIIEFVNQTVPRNYKFWYDKDWLLKYTPE